MGWNGPPTRPPPEGWWTVQSPAPGPPEWWGYLTIEEAHMFAGEPGFPREVFGQHGGLCNDYLNALLARVAAQTTVQARRRAVHPNQMDRFGDENG